MRSPRPARLLRVGRFEATGLEVLADGLHGPFAVAVDAEGVYWLEDDPARAVMRLAKPGS